MAGPEGVTANALAKELGIPPPTLSRWAREAGSVVGVRHDKSNTGMQGANVPAQARLAWAFES
jgi:transposase-like protein